MTGISGPDGPWFRKCPVYGRIASGGFALVQSETPTWSTARCRSSLGLAALQELDTDVITSISRHIPPIQQHLGLKLGQTHQEAVLAVDSGTCRNQGPSGWLKLHPGWLSARELIY